MSEIEGLKLMVSMGSCFAFVDAFLEVGRMPPPCSAGSPDVLLDGVSELFLCTRLFFVDVLNIGGGNVSCSVSSDTKGGIMDDE